MKSAEAFVKALKHGLRPDAALALLPPYALEYLSRVPVIIHRASQELGAQFFPIPRVGQFAGMPLLIQLATDRLDRLRAWAYQRPNWALSTGAVSGIFVLEVDGQEGQESLLALCGDDWTWLDSLRTIAGQKRFIFFAWPKGRRQRERSPWIGKGLRIRGEGAWLVMPPARENGIERAYLNPELSLAPTPAWLIDLVFKPESEIYPLRRFFPNSSCCAPPLPYTTRS